MRRQTILWLLPLAALVVLFAVYFPRKVAQLRSVQAQLRQTQAEVAELQARLTAMNKEYEFLSTDAGLEYLARTLLGYLKPPEKKFVIAATPPPSPTPVRPAP